MFGKMILPYLGSSPSVWNTCMVFYQAILLFGYIYAHISTSILGVRKQAIIHILLILLPFLFLPIHIPSEWKPQVLENPIPQLLGLMFISVGLPFFVISCTAPMLQKWFSSTKHEAAKDPYFLYVASNVGSMVALFGYPFFIEPNFRLLEQSKYWFYFYFLFISCIIICVIFLWNQFSSNLNPQTSNFKSQISNLNPQTSTRFK